MTERIAFASAGKIPPQIAKRLEEERAAKRCTVCDRTTAQAEAIDYQCCRDAG